MVWATAAVPGSLPGLKHLLATNTQTLRGSWLCGLTPAMCLAAPVFPAVVSLAGRGAGTLAELQAGHSWWHGDSWDCQVAHAAQRGLGGEVLLVVETPT